MIKQEFRAVPLRLCQSGACDKRGPSGTLDFSDLRSWSHNGSRATTSFELAYAGTRARCRSSAELPFACSIVDASGARYTVELMRGCLDGVVRRDGALQQWALQTDEVRMAGYVYPAREVAVLDDLGAVVHANASGFDNLEVFTHSVRQPPPALLTAVAAVQAFLQLEDLPRECVRGTA